MTGDIKYCFEDQDIAEVSRNMGELQVRRLPVVNRDKRLVGILSLSDITAAAPGHRSAEALHGISRPGGPHNQES